jgi:threonine aldolase
MIDLRSDTVTRPTDAMRRAMAEAEVGDDVYGEDPTVNRLEAMMAERLGFEAGLYVASGTMGNVAAVLTHAGRGDEMLLGDLSHTFMYEGGAAAGLGGIHTRILPTAADGTLPLDAIAQGIRPDNVHCPRTRLLCLENTHNLCGGVILPEGYAAQAAQIAHAAGATVHLDGARLFNAAVALGCEPASLTGFADSVMVCLSKGLGAPMGSLLCGSKPFIEEARRVRKVMGGGLRQAGIVAAAGIHALEHHVDRLAIDHENARRLAAGIDRIEGLACRVLNGSSTPHTNLVYFQVDGDAIGKPELDAGALAVRLRARGVLANPIGVGEKRAMMRMATHLDVDAKDIDQAIAALRSCMMET